MTSRDDFDRTLADWFEAEALPPVPTDALARVDDGTRRRLPRPAWLASLGSHWVGRRRVPVRLSARARCLDGTCAGLRRSSRS